MNKLAIKTMMAILAGVLLQGCVIAVNTDEHGWSDWRKAQHRNAERIQNLQLGRDLASVQGELGDPDFIDTFMRDGRTWRVLYYRTRQVHSDGRTTRDETTPLVFVDGSLVGWGDAAIENAMAEKSVP